MTLVDVLNVLSPAEKKVFRLMLTSKSLTDIAKELDRTTTSVKFHFKNIFRKLNVRTRVELMGNFTELQKTDQNVVILLFELKKEIDDLKSQFAERQQLPIGQVKRAES